MWSNAFQQMPTDLTCKHYEKRAQTLSAEDPMLVWRPKNKNVLSTVFSRHYWFLTHTHSDQCGLVVAVRAETKADALRVSPLVFIWKFPWAYFVH